MPEKTYEDRCAELIEKATEVPGYDGPIYCPWATGAGEEGYCGDIEQLCDHLEREWPEDATWPRWAFVCDKEPIVMHADRAIESVFSDFPEGEDFVPDDVRKEFEAAVARFNAGIEGKVWIFRDDMTRKAAIPTREEWTA